MRMVFHQLFPRERGELPLFYIISLPIEEELGVLLFVIHRKLYNLKGYFLFLFECIPDTLKVHKRLISIQILVFPPNFKNNFVLRAQCGYDDTVILEYDSSKSQNDLIYGCN